MGKPLSLDLRRRIVACVEAGQSRRAAAAKFDVSPSFVVELMRRYRETAFAQCARAGRGIVQIEVDLGRRCDSRLSPPVRAPAPAAAGRPRRPAR